MAKVTIVKEFPRNEVGAEWVLVERKDEDRSNFFIVSSVNAMITGFETLVFPADEDGNVTSWGEVAGGRGMSRDAAIEDLADRENVEAW